MNINYKLQISQYARYYIFQLEQFISQTAEQFKFNELNDNIN